MDIDFILIQRIKKSDEKSSEIFVRKYYSQILKYSIYKIKNHEDAEDITQETFVELLDKVSLLKDKNRKMGTLSGGMQRRVGIAQAMLNNPKVLILDEPTAGLDPNERIKFRNLISELSEDRLVLLSTHIVSDVESIAKEILIMKSGKFELTGSSNDIILHMNKNIWSLTISKEKADEFIAQYLVVNRKLMHDSVELRIIADDKPSEMAIQKPPTLEDAFLSYFWGSIND